MIIFRANCVTKVCVSSANSHIRVGSESGSVYYIDLPQFEICTNKTITTEHIVKRCNAYIVFLQNYHYFVFETQRFTYYYYKDNY